MKKLNEVKGINIVEVSNMSRKIIKAGTEKQEINYFYTEITKENVNKWNALKKVAHDLNIEEKEIVAIGDNLNDMEMVSNAGCGIVIGNSALSKKLTNKKIVKDCDSDGVADAIKNIILRQ